MAPRLNWSTELRKIIFEDTLTCYHRHARNKEEDGLQELHNEDFLPLPKSIKDSDDEIAKEIHEELRNQILNLFEESFRMFEDTKSKFFKIGVDYQFSTGLNGIDTLFNKLVLNEISENDFEEQYKNRYKRLEESILEDYRELFKSYRNGHYFLFNQFKNSSLDLAGYLSIYYAFKSILSGLWEEQKHGCFIRFHEYAARIGGKPIQLWFCNFIFNGIDFFSSGYSYLDIFEHSKSLKLDRDSFYEICEYIRTSREQLLYSIISRIVTKICSREDFFKGKGGLLASFFKQFINILKRIYSIPSGEFMNVSVDELEDLYNFFSATKWCPRV